MENRSFFADFFKPFQQNALAAAIAVSGVVAFIFAAAFWLIDSQSRFSAMAESQWALGLDDTKQSSKSSAPYDLAQYGVKIPPSRDEREVVTSAKNGTEGAKGYSRDCYENGNAMEESDLCAQWANAAAMRFGNGVAAENYRLNYIVGFITALGVVLASIGVILAAIASAAASRAVDMMAYGFMPVLSTSISHLKPKWISLTIKNVGTGPATDVMVEVQGEPVQFGHDRIGSNSHGTIERRIDGNEVVVRVTYLDISKNIKSSVRRFIKNPSGAEWRLADDQPDDE